MKRPIFVNGRFYHVYNRGVEKRDIFMDNKDYFRFIHDLYEFNDQKHVVNLHFRLSSFLDSSGCQIDYRSPTSIVPVVGRKRNLLVNILCFVLMPNHFHLVLKQVEENGISLFMQKLGTGYTNYFNLKYKRVGPLFQGRYKAILIDKESYLLQLSRYIHLNPIKLIEPYWKEKGIKNLKKAEKFLEDYRWSSYLDYIGKRNFPSLINKRLIEKYFSNPEDYKTFILRITPKDLRDIKDLILEK